MTVAGRPVAVPLQHGVAGTGLQAPAAARTEAERMRHRPVALHRHGAEHGREDDARAVFRRQQLQVEPKRAESGFDRGMRQRQHRLEVLGRLVGIGRWIDMGRRHDHRRIAAVLEPVDQLERGLFQMGQRQLVVVVLVPVVPAADARDAVVQALGEDDRAAAVELRDARGIEPRAVGDADEVGAELARLGLNLGRCQRSPVDLHAVLSACA